MISKLEDDISILQTRQKEENENATSMNNAHDIETKKLKQQLNGICFVYDIV